MQWVCAIDGLRAACRQDATCYRPAAGMLYYAPAGGLSPPALANPGGHVILDTEEFRGPTGLRDSLATRNPVLTDAIITNEKS